MDELNELYEKICCELCEYSKEDLSMENLKVIDTLAHAGKNVMKMMEGGSNSMRGSYADGSYADRSYRMSRKRDSMGRYSRRNSYDNGGSSYNNSFGRSYSNNVSDGLRELMRNAPENMQEDLQKLAQKFDNM